MNRVKYFLVLVASLAVFSIGAPVALALEQPEYGGRSSDYHPPTRNPQGSSPTGLQTTGTGSIQSGGSVINPQALPRTGELRVLTSADNGAVTTAPEESDSDTSGKYLLTWIVGGLLTLIVAVYIIAKPDSKSPAKQDVTQEEAPLNQPAVVADKPKKAKNNSKKKTAKKRKSARR
jgi:hypothetical protein